MIAWSYCIAVVGALFVYHLPALSLLFHVILTGQLLLLLFSLQILVHRLLLIIIRRIFHVNAFLGALSEYI